MSLDQINATYVANEDRLLLRFTTTRNEEYRLWLTRRITMRLLSAGESVALDQLDRIHRPEIARTVDSFRQARLQADIAPGDAFRPAGQLPLGAEPVLVHKADTISPGVPAEPAVSLRLVLANQRRLTLGLDTATLDKIRSLLTRLWQQAEWDRIQPPATTPSTAPLPGPPPSVH